MHIGIDVFQITCRHYINNPILFKTILLTCTENSYVTCIMPLCYTVLTNGFGNNLFQYVAGRLISEHHGMDQVVVSSKPEYYASNSLSKLGINVIYQAVPKDAYKISDNNYVASFADTIVTDIVVQGYFEDYTYYVNKRDLIRSWFPPVRARPDTHCLHLRLGDRLYNPHEIPAPEEYRGIIDRLSLPNVSVVTDIPKLDIVSTGEIMKYRFHKRCKPTSQAHARVIRDTYNSYVKMVRVFNFNLYKGTIVDDFNFMRGCNTIIFAHSTTAWWAAFLSDAETVAVRGRWRPFKGTRNKNLGQTPLGGWIQW